MSFMMDLLARGLLPKNFAGLAIQAQDGKLINLVRAFGVHAPALTSRSVQSCLGSTRSRRGSGGVVPCLLSGGNRGQDKDPVSPNNRRGITRSRHTNFPFHVLGLAPGYRRVCQGRDACRKWFAPLRPELLGCDRWHGCVKNASQKEGCENREKSGRLHGE